MIASLTLIQFRRWGGQSICVRARGKASDYACDKISVPLQSPNAVDRPAEQAPICFSTEMIQAFPNINGSIVSGWKPKLGSIPPFNDGMQENPIDRAVVSHHANRTE
jgi:hypothetical protein